MKKYIIPILQNNLDVTVLRWLAADGSPVEKGQELVELECEKADLTLSSPVAGILKHHRKASEEVLGGEVIGEIESFENYTPAPDNVLGRATTSFLAQANEGLWNFCDSWILASISIGVAPDDPTKGADLSALIMNGDFLNHAILTSEELSTSLTKLLQNNIIVTLEHGFELGEKWREEILLCLGEVVPLAPVTRIKEWLNGRAFVKANSDKIEITEEEHQIAYAQYTQNLV